MLRAFLRPVAKRVASKVPSGANPPAGFENRPLKRATSSTVTSPRSSEAVPDRPWPSPSSGRSLTIVSMTPETLSR